MKKLTTILFLSSILAFSVACGDDDGGGGDDPDAMVDEPDAEVDPNAFPALGTQLDRMGRSAVGTALIGAFLDNATDSVNKKNAYSQDDDASGWVATHAAEIAVNLAIIDSLNSTNNVAGIDPQNGCGDQLAFNNGYGGLADVLADDRILIDSSETTCDQYLAVEANLVLGAGTVIDCGGRSPLVDTVEATYSVLALGALTGVTSGVDAGDEDATHNDDTFPYLAAPL